METILVVDDSQIYLDCLKLGFESFEYRVLVAGSAAEAWLRLESNRVDLILLDVSMPLEDGLSFARRVRADGRHAGIPLIFMTGLAGPADRASAFKAGADDFVPKPCNAAELLPRIRQHLGRRAWQKRLDAGLERIQDVERARDHLLALLGRDVRGLIEDIERGLAGALVPGRLAGEALPEVGKALERAREAAQLVEGVVGAHSFRPLLGSLPPTSPLGGTPSVAAEAADASA